MVTLAAIVFGGLAVTFAVGLGTSLDRVEADLSHAAAQPGQISLPGSGPGGGVSIIEPGSRPGVPPPPLAVQQRSVQAALRAQPGTLHYVAEADDEINVLDLADRLSLAGFGGDAGWTGYALGGPHPHRVRPARRVAPLAPPAAANGAGGPLAPPAPRTLDTGPSGGAGGQPLLADGPPTPVADAVPTLRQPLKRQVQRRHLLPRRLEQRGGVLPLERERRALRVVLVVGPGRTRRLRQPGELPLQRGHPLPGARLLG